MGRTFEIEGVLLLQGEGVYDWLSRTTVDARRAVGRVIMRRTMGLLGGLGTREMPDGHRRPSERPRLRWAFGVPDSDSGALGRASNPVIAPPLAFGQWAHSELHRS